MQSKILFNKSEKQKRIEEAAISLFETCDFNQISIDQIVKKAQVAKGTFYLYFKDKVQLINHLIVKYSSSLIDEALKQAASQKIDDPIEELIFLVDYVVNFFQRNPARIKIIQKNLSWSLIGDKLKDNSYPVGNQLEGYMDFLVTLGYQKEEAFQLIFLILELVSTVCYSSIVLKQPDTIDHLKPLLYESIRKMIKKERKGEKADETFQ